MKNLWKPLFSFVIFLNIVLINGCKEDTPSIAPTITTGTVSDLTANSAKVNGEVTADGGATVTERGIAWGTASNPTINNNKSMSGVGVGTFSTNLTNLTSATTYFARAYATNSVGTSYGLEVSFKTIGVLGTLTTNNVTAITNVSATSGGNITDDGGADITARGVCWSTSPNPTVANSKTSDGNGKGSFSSSISGLAIGTKYYVRAYATNSIGTSYGNEVNFTSLSPPTLTTTAISLLTSVSATSGGNITDNGGADITARGVCWSTSVNPTIADNKITNGSGTGIFNSNISGLNSSTKYYVRAYATNSVGTAYGNEIILTSLAAIPSNGLVAWYPFNGNANDESTNGNNGTVNGASLTTDRNNNSNAAYSFNGTNNFIGLPLLTAINNEEKISIAFWINTSLPQYASVFSHWTTQQIGGSIGLGLGIENTGTFGSGFLGGIGFSTANPVVTANTWNHVVFVFDGTQSNTTERCSVYVNGVFKAYFGIASVPSVTGSLAEATVIGSAVGPEMWGYFGGKLDDIGIWNTALTQQEIQKMYDGTGF